MSIKTFDNIVLLTFLVIVIALLSQIAYIKGVIPFSLVDIVVRWL